MICLTFDTDYMAKAEMERFLREFSPPGNATFFLSQGYDLKMFGSHECAPHPIVNEHQNVGQQLEQFSRQIGVEGLGLRTHSCVFSHQMGVDLAKLGYQYTSVTALLYEASIKPIRQPWGLWELPVYYMDYMDIAMSSNWPAAGPPFQTQHISHLREKDGLYVFDFHPLHIALNTPSMDYYRKVRDEVVCRGASPFTLTYTGRGVRTFYLELLEKMEEASLSSTACSEVVEPLKIGSSS